MSAVFDSFRLGAVALDTMTASRATPEAIAARQTARLVQLLTAAQRGSSLYRERLHGMQPATTALSAIAPVTRSELMQRFDDWVCDPRLKLDELRAFTADPARVGQSFLDRYLVWESSGTSAQPGIFVHDAQVMAVYDALEAMRRATPRPLENWINSVGLSEQRIAFVGATNGHFASYLTFERLRRLNPWAARMVRCFSILQPVATLVAQLDAFAPAVIATYPTAAALLADEAEQGRLRCRPQEVWTGGETLSAGVRLRLQQVLCDRVRNSYGASEFLPMAWECDDGSLHLNADWVLLEPVDEHYRPVPAGHASHSVLLTNLANMVQPLIRYDLGDQITLHSKHCECGSPLPVIEVRGRQDDALVLSGADGRPVTLLPLALTSVLEDQAGVFDFQLCQQGRHTLVLRLALQGEPGAAAAARCRRALKSFASSQGLASLRVRAELGQALPHGRSGKLRRVLA